VTPMSLEQRRLADQERPTATCARLETDPDHICNHLEVSHPLGRVLPQMRWQWIWSCYLTHQGKLKSNEKDLYLAYKQASEEQIRSRYPKTYQDHLQKKSWLSAKYG
jgi:hypothetical protein